MVFLLAVLMMPPEVTLERCFYCRYGKITKLACIDVCVYGTLFGARGFVVAETIINYTRICHVQAISS